MNVYLADETHVAVIERRPSGVGTSVWVGELRTLLNDEPVTAWAQQFVYVNHAAVGGGLKAVYPVSVGTSEAEVLALLIARARDIKARAA